MGVSQLYEANTGVLVGPIDEGDGLRGKDWLHDLPQFAHEMANERGLGDLGLGQAANYPAVINGQLLGSRPLGENYSEPDFKGWELLEAVPQRATLATADGSATAFGSEALTQGALTNANYFNTGADPNDPPAPRGASAPAFVVSDSNATRDISAAGANILQLRVNGTLFSVTISAGDLGAATPQEVADSIRAHGVPVDTLVVSNVLRLWAPGLGVTRSIEVLDSGAGAIFFAANAGTLFRGHGGPLGQIDDTDTVRGAKPQRRILPGSVEVAMTISGETVVARDSTIARGETTGVLSGASADGSVTITGTIDYETGAISATASTAPTDATAVSASYRALVPFNLSDPVRRKPGGRHYALRLAS